MKNGKQEGEEKILKKNVKEEKEQGEDKVEKENDQIEENIRTKLNILEGEMKEKYKWQLGNPALPRRVIIIPIVYQSFVVNY